MIKLKNRNRAERPALIINPALECAVIYRVFSLQNLLVNLSGSNEKNTGARSYLAHSLIKWNWNLNT